MESPADEFLREEDPRRIDAENRGLGLALCIGSLFPRQGLLYLIRTIANRYRVVKYQVQR